MLPSRPHPFLIACAVALAALLLGPAAAQAAPDYPAGFEEREMVRGFQLPVAVAFTPDGRTLVAEKDGRVKVALPGETTTNRVAIDLTARVNSAHDRGMLGMAVDAEFATNQYVYLLYAYDVNPLQRDSSAEMVSQLLRVRLGADHKMTDETVILGSHTAGKCPPAENTLDCIPSDGMSHSIGTVRAAPDGTLYLGSGDAASWSIADPLALRTHDDASMAGKILRVDRNGQGIGGHAFCPTVTDLSQVCTKVHAKGMRNPFRFSLLPDGRSLSVGDVGWGSWEELNIIRTAGNNYGWPCYEGTTRTPNYRDFDTCKAEYAKGPSATTPPDQTWSHRTPQNQYLGGSVVGGPMYTGDQYPAGFRNSVFYGDYVQGFVKRVELDADNRVVAAHTFVPQGWSGVDLTTAPSGDVVYVDIGTGRGDGSVKRIVYSPGNATPIPSVTATPSSGPAPLNVAFDARASHDPNGDTLSYRWDFGDGTPVATGTATPSHTYTQAGTYTATLTVDDGRGATATSRVTITAGNDVPVAKIDAPADGSEFNAGDVVQLRGSATDPQDGGIPSSRLSWRVTLVHGTHTHTMGTYEGSSTSFRTVEDHDSDSYYEVVLTATDSGGLTATQKVVIRPRTIPLRIESQPAGAPVAYGSVGATAPFAADAAIGYSTTVSAAESFTSGGVRYVFDRWSDGSPRSHAFKVPATATTLTAIYTPAPTSGLPEGLVAAYAFDETSGTTATDASGTGNTGTIRGTTRTTGVRGGALSFDGVDDWVTVADNATLDLTTSMTITAWVKSRTDRDWQTIAMKEQPGSLSYGLYAVSDSPVPSSWIGASGAYADAALTRNTWRHVALSVSGNQQRLHIDGVQVNAAYAATAPIGTGALRIGGNSAWGEFLDGELDDVRVYNRGLSAAEITTDRDTATGPSTPPPTGPQPVASWGFESGSGTTAADGTGNGHTGTIRGATWTSGKYGGGLQFDGVDDWVTVGDANALDLTNRWTLSAWVRPESTSSWQTVIAKERPGSLSYVLHSTSGTNVPSGWSDWSGLNGTSALPANTWSHLAVTAQDGTMRIYVDGRLQRTVTGAVSAPVSAGVLRIGGNGVYPGEFFKGRLDDVRVYGQALTQDELAAAAASGVSVARLRSAATLRSFRLAKASPGAKVARCATKLVFSSTKQAKRKRRTVGRASCKRAKRAVKPVTRAQKARQIRRAR